MNTLAGARVERPKKHLSATQSLAAATTPELGRLTFQHSTVDGRCSGCGYESTVTEPLCPVAAAALGEMLRRGPHPSTRSIKLSKLSTNDLLVSASAHRPTPAGRCHRCGFAYTAQCQDCPSLRLIRQELVPHQATFALSTISRSRWLSACLLRQMM